MASLMEGCWPHRLQSTVHCTAVQVSRLVTGQEDRCWERFSIQHWTQYTIWQAAGGGWALPAMQWPSSCLGTSPALQRILCCSRQLASQWVSIIKFKYWPVLQPTRRERPREHFKGCFLRIIKDFDYVLEKIPVKTCPSLPDWPDQPCLLSSDLYKIFMASCTSSAQIKVFVG